LEKKEMDVDQLTDEQIAKLTPEQIEILENNPEKLIEILALQQPSQDVPQETPSEKPEQEDNSAANGAGSDEDSVQDEAAGKDASGTGKEEEPAGVSTKNGKGIIPYEKHKELRVENSTLRQQLREVQSKLEDLLKRRNEDRSAAGMAEADNAIAKHLETLKGNMPELHEVITAVLEGSRKQGEKLEQTLSELEREKEESERQKQLSVAEQVAEAKDNNPDLVHWESNDPEAWDEALRQDEILRTSSRWANKPYAERFEEVARRVRAIMPDASPTRKQPDPESVKAEARAKLEKAPARKPTTLSDIHGGVPASPSDEVSMMSPHELARKLMTMPAHKAAALRAELD
jgi:hypothetical protein